MKPTFGGLVADRRKSLLMNQDDLAERVNISRNYVSLIERNQAPHLSVGILWRLAEVLEVDTDALLAEYIEQYGGTDDR